MTTSGTYAYNPSLGELTLYSFGQCGVRPTALTSEHMQDARMAANLMQAEWAAKGVNLWKVDLVTIPLVQGVSVYSYDPDIIVILDAYITVGQGTAATDRYILPISRTEYASYANKQQQGFPTVYWADRLQSPNVTLWPVPDGNEISISFYVVRQIEDAVQAGALQADIQFYFLEAYANGLAFRLAKIWAPERAAMLKAEAMESFSTAITQNVETASTFFSPTLSSYWRV